MTTGEKGSRLKTTLGLENLKGLGDTLKQVGDFMREVKELKEIIGEAAKENNPISRALAQAIEAQGLRTLNEDGINISEEVRKTMVEELKNKGKTIEELEVKNKELTEDKVISEVTSKVTAELDKRLPQPGSQGNDSGGSKLFKAIEDVVAKKLEHLLGGGGEGTLTSEEIRKVVKEEVTAVAGGNKKPEEMVEDLVNALTMGDKLREKLGVAGIGGRLIQGQGGDSGLRTDLVKVLLEDERERLKIAQSHEAETQRNQHLGTLATAVKDNLGDGIAALTAAAREVKQSPRAKTPAAEQPQVLRCGDCGTEFSPPAGWADEPIKCPNPSCGREYSKEELLG